MGGITAENATSMMPRSARIAVGVLAMLVVALSSDLPAFQESDPHLVDGKTQIFQAGYQAGQQAAKSETDAKLSKAIEAAQQQKKIAEAAQQAAKSETDAKLSNATEAAQQQKKLADAALQQLAGVKKQKKIVSAKKAAKGEVSVSPYCRSKRTWIKNGCWTWETNGSLDLLSKAKRRICQKLKKVMHSFLTY